MNRIARLFTGLMKQESAQDLIEYALIPLGAMVAMGSLSNAISSEFNGIGNSLEPSPNRKRIFSLSVVVVD